MYPTTIPANIVPNPIPLNEPYNVMDNIAPIMTFDVSNAVLSFPNSMCVTCLTASDTPSPGSTIAFDVTSMYTPNAIMKQLIMHSIHCDM